MQIRQTTQGIIAGAAVAALGFGLGIPLWIKGARDGRRAALDPDPSMDISLAVMPQGAAVRWAF